MFAEALPAGPRVPLAGGGGMNCGSRVLRPPRGGGGSASRAVGLGSEGAEPIQHPSHLAFLFRPLRPGLARTPRARTWFVIRRAAKRRPLVLLIVVLESLPQSLQFEDQRLALRRRDVLIRPAGPVARHSFIGMHVIKTLHDETLSAIDARCSALACGGGCGDPGAPLPPALRTRANTSALGPNAIALPS